MAEEKREMQKRKSEVERENEEGMKGKRVAKVHRTSNAMKVSLSSAEKFHMTPTRSFLSLVFCSFSLTMAMVLLLQSIVDLLKQRRRWKNRGRKKKKNRLILSEDVCLSLFQRVGEKSRFLILVCIFLVWTHLFLYLFCYFLTTINVFFFQN